jgi:Fe-S-cluster containining protein
MEVTENKLGASACDTCRSPGACCRSFQLNREWPPGTTRDQVIADLASGRDAFTGEVDWTPDLPFEPIRESSFYAVSSNDEEPASTRWSFSCPKLGDDGRCTIYEERPELCRSYVAESDPMCAEFNGPWSGDDFTHLTEFAKPTKETDDVPKT